MQDNELSKEQLNNVTAATTAAEAAKIAATVAAEAVKVAATVAAEAAKIASTAAIESARVGENISFIKAEIIEIKTRLDHKFVSKEEFEPVKRVVYAIVSVLLLAVLASIAKLIFIQ